MMHPSTRRAVSHLVTSCLLAAFVVMPDQALKVSAAETTTTLVAFGDSLTAGYQLPPAAAFPAQLEVALRAKGYKVKVVNAGVSGDTTANGLDRLEWTLAEPADGVILELGANDALRGVDPAVPRANLDQMVLKFKSKGADVLLAGMRAPANWGPEYKAAFDAIYPDLASRQSVAIYPYFLDGIRMEPKLLQTDGLHPTAEGVAEIVKRILPSVEAQLKRIEARKAAANP
jgi:acyl-CoA thioesterase I